MQENVRIVQSGIRRKPRTQMAIRSGLKLRWFSVQVDDMPDVVDDVSQARGIRLPNHDRRGVDLSLDRPPPTGRSLTGVGQSERQRRQRLTDGGYVRGSGAPCGDKLPLRHSVGWSDCSARTKSQPTWSLLCGRTSPRARRYGVPPTAPGFT